MCSVLVNEWAFYGPYTPLRTNMGHSKPTCMDKMNQRVLWKHPLIGTKPIMRFNLHHLYQNQYQIQLQSKTLLVQVIHQHQINRQCSIS